LLAAELAFGLIFHSLTLLADATHLLTDVFGLGVALVAIRLTDRPPSARLSFGMQRAETLAAQTNAYLLVGVSTWIFVEAGRRLGHPQHVSGMGLLAVASVGLAVNLGSAWLIRRHTGASLNMRGAWLHLASDAGGSLGAMAAVGSILLFDNHRVDPAIAKGIAMLVIWTAVRLVRESFHVLLEGTPVGVNPEEIENALRSFDGVGGVHHLHVWSLASDVPALSAHVVLTRDDASIHEAQEASEQLKAMLADRFGITHSTLEVECHEHAASEHTI
jgi:cobalt-zinc-cadmium efflux system protein